MFGIGSTELLIIAVFALIIFGPDKLPEIARTAGKAWRTFKSAQEDMERVIKAEMYTPNRDNEMVMAEVEKAKAAAETKTEAASIWAATAEDDEEEEDEE